MGVHSCPRLSSSLKSLEKARGQTRPFFKGVLGGGVYVLGDKEFMEIHLSSPICLNGKYGEDFPYICTVIITKVQRMFATLA